MRTALTWFVAVSLAANGLLMLMAPQFWYDNFPGVVEHGPFNQHFVADIGIASLTSGIAYLWLALDPRAWPAAMVAALYLLLHSLLHLWDGLAGHVAPSTAIAELGGLAVTTVLAFLAAWPTTARTFDRKELRT